MSHGVSIIITTYNRARLLETTLWSAAALDIPPGVRAEILVVDNNCTDATPEVVRRVAAESPIPMRWILETQQGLSYSRNRGLREAAFDVVVYFDDDVRIDPGWIGACLEAIDQLSADGVTGPVTPAFECEVPRYINQRVLGSLTSAYSLKGERMMLLPPEVAFEVPGCNFAVSKQAAIEVGGFDPRFGCGGNTQRSGDDFEFGRRLQARGKRVAYQPRCSIHHVITSEKLSKAWLRKRWRQDGAFVRAMTPGASALRSPLGRARASAGVARMVIASLLLDLMGRRAESFEWELKARHALGYIKGE